MACLYGNVIVLFGIKRKSLYFHLWLLGEKNDAGKRLTVGGYEKTKNGWVLFVFFVDRNAYEQPIIARADTTRTEYVPEVEKKITNKTCNFIFNSHFQPELLHPNNLGY